MKPKPLLDSDSGSDSDDSSQSNVADNKERENDKDPEKSVRFAVNTKYARDYQSRKQREELQRERHHLGNGSDDSGGGDEDDGSSSSSSEDEDGELLTPRLDVGILKTINALRSKDQVIYDSSVRFFPGSDEEEESGDDDDDVAKRQSKKSKPKRVKDVLREQILEQMKEEDDADIDTQKQQQEDTGKDEKTSRLAYDEQQQELRKAFLDKEDYSQDSDDNDKNEEDDFLVIKKRHTSTSEEDEQAKKLFEEELRRMEESTGNVKDKLVDPRGEVEDGEQFLLNFIKHKTWMEEDHDHINLDDEMDVVPVKSKASKRNKVTNEEGDNDDDDDDSLEDLEKADDFEAQYNFRFEEANTATASGADVSVRGYARSQTMNTLRRKDETRRNKRLARKERKDAERKVKEEKLKRLKNAKREEIERKMKQVKAVLGATSSAPSAGGDEGEKMAFNDGEAPIDEAAILKLLEGDYDPEKFEQHMQKAFGDDFYEKEDSEWKTDEDVRNTLKRDGDVELYDYDDAEDEGAAIITADNDDEEKVYDEDGLEEDYHDDAYGDDDVEEEHEDETEIEKNVRTKLMDKLYELDYEDIVAGMPTRFKYREVEPNNYGLTTEEILLARDQTLKQYVSLKKMAPYREGEEYRVSSRKRRKFRELLKQDIAEAEAKLKEEGVTINNSKINDEDTPNKKKRRRLKKNGEEGPGSKGKADAPVTPAVTSDEANEATDGGEPNKSKKRRKKKSKKTKLTDETDLQPMSNREKEPMSHSESKVVATGKSGNSEGGVKRNGERKKKKKRKKKDVAVHGVSESRLASYGL